MQFETRSIFQVNIQDEASRIPHVRMRQEVVHAAKTFHFVPVKLQNTPHGAEHAGIVVKDYD